MKSGALTLLVTIIVLLTVNKTSEAEPTIFYCSGKNRTGTTTVELKISYETSSDGTYLTFSDRNGHFLGLAADDDVQIGKIEMELGGSKRQLPLVVVQENEHEMSPVALFTGNSWVPPGLIKIKSWEKDMPFFLVEPSTAGVELFEGYCK